MNNPTKSRGRHRRDGLTEAIRLFANLTAAEFAAAQQCVAAMRALAAARAGAQSDLASDSE